MSADDGDTYKQTLQRVKSADDLGASNCQGRHTSGSLLTLFPGFVIVFLPGIWQNVYKNYVNPAQRRKGTYCTQGVPHRIAEHA